MSSDINRCQFCECNKKLKITDLSCKCGKTFCKIHKFPEDHSCEYDYKETSSTEKKIDELKCIGVKVTKIN